MSYTTPLTFQNMWFKRQQLADDPFIKGFKALCLHHLLFCPGLMRYLACLWWPMAQSPVFPGWSHSDHSDHHNRTFQRTFLAYWLNLTKSCNCWPHKPKGLKLYLFEYVKYGFFCIQVKIPKHFHPLRKGRQSRGEDTGWGGGEC